jgi:hypothetical protein
MNKSLMVKFIANLDNVNGVVTPFPWKNLSLIFQMNKSMMVKFIANLDNVNRVVNRCCS